VCHNLAFRGDYSPVLAKHSKHFSLEDALSIGVDRMQRNFEPMRRQVESWRAEQLSAEAAKLTVCRLLSRGNWTSRDTWRGGYTNSTSIRSTRSSNPGPCGACRTRSPRRSRNSIRFRNSGQPRNWGVFLKPPLRHDGQSILLGQRAISTGSLKTTQRNDICSAVTVSLPLHDSQTRIDPFDIGGSRTVSGERRLHRRAPYEQPAPHRTLGFPFCTRKGETPADIFPQRRELA
jgi:hypothetical protein